VPKPDPKTTTKKLWALFKDDERISRYHSSREAACVEAFEAKVVIHDKFGNQLANGYEIKCASGKPESSSL
jgi:hypothetical protein